MKRAVVGVLVASAGVLVVAGIGWVLFPRLRPIIAAAVILSPIPPIP